MAAGKYRVPRTSHQSPCRLMTYHLVSQFYNNLTVYPRPTRKLHLGRGLTKDRCVNLFSKGDTVLRSNSAIMMQRLKYRSEERVGTFPV